MSLQGQTQYVTFDPSQTPEPHIILFAALGREFYMCVSVWERSADAFVRLVVYLLVLNTLCALFFTTLTFTCVPLAILNFLSDIAPGIFELFLKTPTQTAEHKSTQFTLLETISSSFH